MIEPILEWSLKNRAMVIIASLVLVAGGLNAMSRLPIDAVPDVTNVQVQVLTTSPALGPEEVEKFVTTPIGTSTRRHLDEALARTGKEPTIAVETDQREAIVPLVLAGAGAALLPRTLGDLAAQRGAIVVPVVPRLCPAAHLSAE